MSVQWWREQVWLRYNKAVGRNDETACAAYLKMAGQHLGTLTADAPSTREAAMFAFLKAAMTGPHNAAATGEPALPGARRELLEGSAVVSTTVDADATAEAVEEPDAATG